MGGHDPYSNSKGCAELVASAYRRSFFAGGGTARRHRARGQRDRRRRLVGDRLVPDIVRAFERGESVEIRSPPRSDPGSTFSSRWPVTSPWRSACAAPTARPSPRPGTSARPTRIVGPCPMFSIRSPGTGVGTRAGTAPNVTIHTRRMSSRSTPPRHGRVFIGIAGSGSKDALSWTAEWYREQGRGASAAI